MSALTIGILTGVFYFGPLWTVTPEEEARVNELVSDGWQLLNQGKAKEAVVLFEEAVGIDPTSQKSINGLGWAQMNAGDSEDARSTFEGLLEQNASHAAALNGLGWICFWAQEHGDAEQHWLKASDLGATAAWGGLSRLYLLQEEWDKAEAYAEKILAVQPGESFTQRVLSAAQNEEVPPGLMPFLRHDTNSGAAQDGWKYFRQGDYVRAEAEFRKVLEENDDDASAHNGLGFVLLNSGKVAQAKPHFESCLRLAPHHGGALNGLARCLKAEGDIEQAVEIWERVYTPTAKSASAWGLADAYFELEQFEKAVPIYEMLLRAHPEMQYLKERLALAQSKVE